MSDTPSVLPRPITDPITLRLDRWASILRNCQDHPSGTLTLSDEECAELSTLLTVAANSASPTRGAAVTVDRDSDDHAAGSRELP